MEPRVRSGAEFFGDSLVGNVVKTVVEKSCGTVMLEFVSGLKAKLYPTAHSNLNIVGRKIVETSVRQEGEFHYLRLVLDPGGESEFLV